MKAIIISDAEARSLLDQLELANMRKANVMRTESFTSTEEIHRAFHYVVTRWLQEMGADVVHK